jgi:hypothetical protein
LEPCLITAFEALYKLQLGHKFFAEGPVLGAMKSAQVSLNLQPQRTPRAHEPQQIIIRFEAHEPDVKLAAVIGEVVAALPVQGADYILSLQLDQATTGPTSCDMLVVFHVTSQFTTIVHASQELF